MQEFRSLYIGMEVFVCFIEWKFVYLYGYSEFIMFLAILVTLILTPFFLLIVSGKGDNLIAGYNTATEKERARYNIKRLRGVIAIALLFMIVAFWIPCMFSFNVDRKYSIVYIFLLGQVVSIVTVVLANTWAKRK